VTKRGYLLIEKGPGSGQKYWVDDDRPVVIGRGKRCVIQLDDSWCSREHCVVELQGGEAWLRDLGSKNGTSVNGLPVDEWAMSPGDRVILGATTLMFLEEEGDISVGHISLEEDDETATIDLLREVRLESTPPITRSTRAKPPGPWDGLFGAVNQIADLAQSATQLAPFFADVLAGLIEQTEAVDGALALVDVHSRELTDQVTADPRGSFTLKTNLVDAVINRKEITVLAKERGPRMVGAPIWIEGCVAGLICLKLPPDSHPVDQQFLLLMGVLGNLIGGTVQNIRRVRGLEREKNDLRRGIQSQFDMIGQSKQMKQVYKLIAGAAKSDASVLISGESGTGKELVARAIHYRSRRSEGPFVTLNSASLPLELVESDLFGHVQGAFTGAIRDKPGKFEMAQDGTFFLDEIGELDIRVQAKLLRVLEDGTFSRVGDTETRTSNARVITATNRRLMKEVQREAFREDLFYRLRVLEIKLPPLRDRPDDIPLLVQHFVARFSEEMGKRNDGPTDRAMKRLKAHPWRGNVRELRNCLERAMVMTSGEKLTLEDLEFLNPSTIGEAELPSLRELEHQHIARILELTNGNKSKAARMLGIDRSTLYQKIREIESS